MPNYKVCVYAISKNEEQFVDRWMDAVQEADLVVVTDTGSTDATVEKLRARGAVVHEQAITPWRFDAARNAAMDNLPDDADICVSNDLDEVFEKGWRERLERAWTPECTRARYWFAWSHHEDGSIYKRFSMEKIHRRHGFRWVRPVHEILQYSGQSTERSVLIDGLVLHHYPDPEKPRSQYLPLLELSVQENPQDDRATFWLGREYLYYNEYGKAISALQRYLELPSAQWPEERSAAMCYIAQAHRQIAEEEQAGGWLLRAAAECPHTREPWLALARAGYTQGDWPLTYFAVEKGLAVTERTDSYLTDPFAWGYALYDFGAISCYWLGMLDKALAYAQSALRHRPEDERLQRNAELIRAKRAGK